MSKRQGNQRKDRRTGGEPRRAPAKRVSDCILIYGIHAAEAALGNNDRLIQGVYVTSAAAERLKTLLSARDIQPSITTNDAMSARLGEHSVHQGVLIEAAHLPLVAVEDLAPASPLIVLDQVTDPQNVGAVLRSAAAFGAGAVIVQDRNAPLPTGALAKAATGALEHTPYVQVTNIARALAQLKRDGYWIIGLDGDGESTLESAVSDAVPIVLVLGAEGSGLRRLTREVCDIVARLDLPGPIKALNVSNAAAIALYAVQARQAAGLP